MTNYFNEMANGVSKEDFENLYLKADQYNNGSIDKEGLKSFFLRLLHPKKQRKECQKSLRYNLLLVGIV